MGKMVFEIHGGGDPSVGVNHVHAKIAIEDNVGWSENDLAEILTKFAEFYDVPVFCATGWFVETGKQFPAEQSDKFVVVFDDEMSDEELDKIFEDVGEGGADLLLAIDNNTKAAFKAPVLPPDADIQNPKDYWFSVFEEVTHPCCGNGVEVGVVKVVTLEEFVQTDKELNPPDGIYPEFSELL